MLDKILTLPVQSADSTYHESLAAYLEQPDYTRKLADKVDES